MSSPSKYHLYGICIGSEFPFAAPLAPETSAPDLTVQQGEGLLATTGPSAGEVWAKADLGNGFGVQLTKTDAGWSLLYPQTGEVRLTADLCHATAHALPGKSEILPLLLIGSVPAWWLNLYGESILHASAVAADGEAPAFIGAPARNGGNGMAALVQTDGEIGQHLCRRDDIGMNGLIEQQNTHRKNNAPTLEQRDLR